MTDLEGDAEKFWRAALYVRRGIYRDRSIAFAVLRQLAETSTVAVQSRAANTLKEHDVEQSDSA